MNKMQFRTLCAAAVATLMAGCSSVDLRAPIEDRTGSIAVLEKQETRFEEAQALPITGEEAKVVPSHLAAEAVPQSSGVVHTVSAGDTLYNIGVRYGVNPRELARLNGVTNPAALSIGLELQIPSSAKKIPAPAETVSEGEAIVIVTNDPALQQEAPAQAPEAAPAPGAAPEQTAATEDNSRGRIEIAKRPETPEEAAMREIEEQRAKREAAARNEIGFIWPAKGEVIADFAATKRGIDIAANEGDPVLAVLDGTVQYVGNNAKGYGNFVIVRHAVKLPGKGNTPLVTVYGNTSRVLVNIGESVKAGQKIAEVGNSDSEVFKLRFEIRQGKPIDPAEYLAPAEGN